jgi:hypothetical protein
MMNIKNKSIRIDQKQDIYSADGWKYEKMTFDMMGTFITTLPKE